MVRNGVARVGMCPPLKIVVFRGTEGTEDETMNTCPSALAKRTSVFGCVIPRGKKALGGPFHYRIVLSLGSEPALPGEADGAERRRERRRLGHEPEKRGKEQNLKDVNYIT